MAANHSEPQKVRTTRADVTTEERFLAKVNKTSKCWTWTASIIKDTGYGAFRINGKTVGAHRIAYELFIGTVPSGMQVLHKCDNRKCVRPSHLFIGTAVDNVFDMADKGRAFWQNSSGRAKQKKASEAYWKNPENRVARGELSRHAWKRKTAKERKEWGEAVSRGWQRRLSGT